MDLVDLTIPYKTVQANPFRVVNNDNSHSPTPGRTTGVQVIVHYNP